MNVETPDSDAIDSTFQQTSDEPRFEGTHVHDPDDGPNVAIDREYFTNTRGSELVVYTIYYVDGQEVNTQRQTWSLTEDGEHVEHSRESIEAFARSNHFTDPQLDVEFAYQSSE